MATLDRHPVGHRAPPPPFALKDADGSVVSSAELLQRGFVAVALGIGIFIFDTVSPLQFAVAVLYVVVVLVAATSYRRRVV